MGRFTQVHHLVNDNVLQQILRFSRELRIQPDMPRRRAWQIAWLKMSGPFAGTGCVASAR